MSWLLLTFISVISRAIYGTLTKVFSNQLTVSPHTQAVLLPLAGGVITVLASPALGGIRFDLAEVNILTLILMITGQGFGNIIYFKAIKNLTSATAQIAFSSILLFNTLLSVIFLHLKLSALNGLGLVVLMAAILLAITGKVTFHRQGVGLMVISAFSFAVFQLTSSQLATQMSSASYLLFAHLGAAILTFLSRPQPIYREIKHITATHLKITVLTALPSMVQFVSLFYAYRSAPVPAKVALLATSQVVFAVLLSYLFLKEKQSLMRKLIAALLVVVASILIKN